jgi:selenocysteine-specific elongation factor
MPAMFVVGTAGHVDHGKSALIQALTGINPDRLREEQERGLTSELGFAWLTLPSGREISIIDVPGHVRFVRHMLAGVGGIDLALLVIAADEGVMPQTREHLEILDLLEVEHGIVALTKRDLVDEEWAALVAEDVRELLEPTRLAGAPIVEVSSVTGAGLDELRATLDKALEAVEEPRDIGRPRLGVDRVFTMSGFGTVVTGTLLDGRLRVGDAVELTPGGDTARIRGLQTHQQAVEEALPGSRVAVNLAGIDLEDISRGQVLSAPGRLQRVGAFDARLRVLEHRPLRHNLRVSLHVGAADVQARVRILDGDAIAAGAEGWAQIVLTEPVAAVPGDLFVLRVSDQTVAGGRIVEVNPPRHRRSSPETLARLEARAAGTPESRVVAALEHVEPATREEFASSVELSADQFSAALAALVEAGDVLALPVEGGDHLYLNAARLAGYQATTEAALAQYHAAFPLRFTMPREELRSRLGIAPRAFAAVLRALEPAISSQSGGVVDAGWTPAPSEAQRAAIEEVAALLEASAAQPPRLDADPEVLAHLQGAGRIVDCGDGVYMAAPAFDDARRQIEAMIRERGEVTLADARDALGTNRRTAQALLETLDRIGVTRRQGDARVLV